VSSLPPDGLKTIFIDLEDTMSKSVKELWEAHAQENGKSSEYVETKAKAFPPSYEYALKWDLIQHPPLVTDPTKDCRWNEHSYYNMLMELFAKDVAKCITRIKSADRAQAKRIEDLLKRVKSEEPSSELLGLYATYRVAVHSALDANVAAAKAAPGLNSDAESKLAEIGKRFYKVLHAGKAVLYDVENDEWTSYKDCLDHFAHMKIKFISAESGRSYTKVAFRAFQEWPKAPLYNTVVFNPRRAGHYDDKFNLWQGFVTQPEKGDDDQMLWELLRRICDYNENYFNYVQKWLAHMIQKPWERPGTALGISGEQGLGKNAFVETVGMLLTTTQMMDLMSNASSESAGIGKVLSTGAFGYFTSYDEVFGSFNALAGNKILLFLDEATWGGGHTQKARLKTAITGPTVTINDKHMKHLVVQNCRRFIFASNEEFYYGADPSDRRLLPLEYQTKNRPTDEWFRTFYEMRRASKMVAHLLYRLQHIDLTGWEPMRALRELEVVTGNAIQLDSAPDYQKWMDDMADTGTMAMPKDAEFPEYRKPVCGRFITEDELRKSFQLWTGRQDMKGWNSADFVAARTRIFGPRVQKRVIDDERAYGRKMPSQEDMRKRLDAQYRWKRNVWGGAVLEEGDEPMPEAISISLLKRLQENRTSKT
jgi:hypothetical protein